MVKPLTKHTIDLLLSQLEESKLMGKEGEVRRFGEKLRTLRTQRSMTTRELAKALGITNGSVSNIETGKTKPNIDFVHRVATYFGISADDLLDDSRDV